MTDDLKQRCAARRRRGRTDPAAIPSLDINACHGTRIQFLAKPQGHVLELMRLGHLTDAEG